MESGNGSTRVWTTHQHADKGAPASKATRHTFSLIGAQTHPEMNKHTRIFIVCFHPKVVLKFACAHTRTHTHFHRNKRQDTAAKQLPPLGRDDSQDGKRSSDGANRFAAKQHRPKENAQMPKMCAREFANSNVLKCGQLAPPGGTPKNRSIPHWRCCMKCLKSPARPSHVSVTIIPPEVETRTPLHPHVCPIASSRFAAAEERKH